MHINELGLRDQYRHLQYLPSFQDNYSQGTYPLGTYPYEYLPHLQNGPGAIDIYLLTHPLWTEWLKDVCESITFPPNC